MEEQRIQAYGKINLSLDVKRKRPDGYHDVCMVMQTVKLHDRIRNRLGDYGLKAIRSRAFYFSLSRGC